VIPIYFPSCAPGLQDGEHVNFQIGDVVTYKTRNGDVLKITIDSERKVDMESGTIEGYESIFHDDGKKYFAAAKGIINWDGKR
jgi:hypothetical protein